MTTDSQPTTDAQQKVTPLYESCLPEEARELFQAADGDSDLDWEIRICRTILALLSEEPVKNHRSMVSVMNTLIRAITLQCKRTGGTTDLERWLEEVAEKLDDQAGPAETDE
jgi:hypothetical protein